jgi:hypothetical protein
MRHLNILRKSIIAAVAGFASVSGIAAADTMVVTPTNTYGWTFAQDNPTPGTGAFVDGPATPPMGTGSAQLTTDATTDGPILFKAAYQGLKLSAITALQYSTYRTLPSGTSPLAIALQFNIDSDVTDANNTYQGRLVFEPYQDGSTVVAGAWQTWNALGGLWWGSGGGPTRPISQACPQSDPCTLSEIVSMFPNAGIHLTQGAVVFKAGSGWMGAFDGNVDALTINGDTWDFNLHSTPANRDECKNDGYKNFNPPGGPYKNQGQCVAAANHQ